jgi:hypothetical protein
MSDRDVYVLDDPKTERTSSAQILLHKPDPGPVPKMRWISLPRTQIKNITILDPSVRMFNIPFEVNREGDAILLENHNWPILTVSGNSFDEALENLGGLLKTIVREYVFVPESELAEDAVQFRRYLINKLL